MAVTVAGPKGIYVDEAKHVAHDTSAKLGRWVYTGPGSDFH